MLAKQHGKLVVVKLFSKDKDTALFTAKVDAYFADDPPVGRSGCSACRRTKLHESQRRACWARTQAGRLPGQAVRRSAVAGRAPTRHEARTDAVRRADQRARSGGDERNVSEMEELAGDGMTMIVVTHEMGFAEAAVDRVAMIDDGQDTEEGPRGHFFLEPSELRTRQFLSKIL